MCEKGHVEIDRRWPLPEHSVTKHHAFEAPAMNTLQIATTVGMLLMLALVVFWVAKLSERPEHSSAEEHPRLHGGSCDPESKDAED